MKKLLLKRFRDSIPTISPEILQMYDESAVEFLVNRLKEEVAKIDTAIKKDDLKQIAFFAALLHQRCVDGAVETHTFKQKRPRGQNTGRLDKAAKGV
jgi:hypothetical protein